MIKKKSKIIAGWQEWCALPGLYVPAIKMKLDTGARTSALHAHHIEQFTRDDKKFVRFEVHPLQRNRKIGIVCEAPLADQRDVKSSSGHSEFRPVILTPITWNNIEWEIELTLTNRDTMGFRMLLGRKAMEGHMLVDPSKRFTALKMTSTTARKLYKSGAP